MVTIGGYSKCPECQDLFQVPHHIENGNFFCPNCGTHLHQSSRTGAVIKVLPILRDNKDLLVEIFSELERTLNILAAIRIKGEDNLKLIKDDTRDVPVGFFSGDAGDLIIKTIESQEEAVRLARLAKDAVKREQRDIESWLNKR